MLANLELPYFEGISINNAAFHLQNSQPSVNAIAGKFTAADGIGEDGMGGKTVTIALTEGFSTTGLVERLRK